VEEKKAKANEIEHEVFEHPNAHAAHDHAHKESDDGHPTEEKFDIELTHAGYNTERSTEKGCCARFSAKVEAINEKYIKKALIYQYCPVKQEAQDDLRMVTGTRTTTLMQDE
jgi:hypothetical protein